jgi:signal transduction histidine kinase
VTVPVYQREVFAGRLYLTSDSKIFSYADAEFLGQILDHAVPVIENVNLLDRLASEATEEQRRKISRDIHDSAVQPYIGIKFGLEALQIKRAAGDDIAAEIDQLIEMANSNIVSIRSYINKLKGDRPGAEKGAVLVTALRQQARKISEFYGISIEVAAADNLFVSDRLSAEIFQIVTEALSNIKRHTKADRVSIRIEADEKRLRLEVENNRPAGDNGDFMPKSIHGRAESLGGKLFVVNDKDRTRLRVEIPL